MDKLPKDALSIWDQLCARGYWVVTGDIFDNSRDEAHFRSIMADKQPFETARTVPFGVRLAMVRQQLSYIEKDGFNEFHKYKYVKAEDVQAQVGKALAENFILVRTRNALHEFKAISDKEMECTLRIEYGLADAFEPENDAKVLWFPVCGIGRDKGDKSAYKASTGARKYFLIDALLLPIGDDPEDSAKDDEERAKGSVATKPQSGAPASPDTAQPSGTKLTGDQVAELMQLVEATNSDLGRVLNHFKVTIIADVPYKEAKSLLERKRDQMRAAETGTPQP